MYSLAERLQICSRQAKLECLLREFKPTGDCRALAVGVDAHSKYHYSNFLEYNYPYRQQLTCVTLDRPEEWTDQAKELNLVRGDGRYLPFADDSFDIAFSNAVIEHVGSYDDQRRFVEEMCRVVPRVFVTTPNFYFPYEMHVKIPFVHLLPVRMAKFFMLKYGKSVFYAKQWGTSLRLLKARELKSMFPSNYEVRVQGVRITFMPESLIAIARRKDI